MKEFRRKEKITVLRMTGNLAKQFAWSDEVPFEEKLKKDPEKSTSLLASKKTFEENERKRKRDGLQWDLDVQSLVSSTKWLQLHGLKRNKLSFPQILSQIGFQHKEDYVSILGKLVASRYANGLYRQFSAPQDGRMYNGAIELYRQRMEWLTTESRQLFGVIQDQSITIVLDFGISSGDQFDLCREALSMVLMQQVSRIEKFNLIQAAEDFVKWQDKTVPVNKETLEAAAKWLWELEPISSECHTGPTEAIMEALFDDTTEAVYYFSVGDMPECVKHLLLKKISRSPCPIHTVSFNAKEEDTIVFLRELSQVTEGRFHAFIERTDYEDTVIQVSQDKEERRRSMQNAKRLKGGQPAGTGVREDVFLIWKELEEARNTELQIQIILSEFEQPKPVEVPVPKPQPSEPKSDYVNSKDWIQQNGLNAKKLTMSTAFGDCTFRHINGIVDIKTKPQDESVQTDADRNAKLIHAKYCNNFVHTYLEDGTIVHIHSLTAERCRRFEERVRKLLDQMERRLQEVQKGSRALFGDIHEERIYILIDTSQSMRDKLPVVKQKLFQLMREQLQKKSKVNFVKFDNEPVAWKEKLTEVNEDNLEDALRWVKGLTIGSSTDIMKALQVALSDTDTQVIYLLTDGRPDQPPSRVLAQLDHQRRVPVHTISFNCDDIAANRFLHDLARDTGGRFYYYHIQLRDPQAPKSFECEDIYLLKKEIENGKEELKKIQAFHNELLLTDRFHGGKTYQHEHRRQPFVPSSIIPQVEGQNPPPPDRPYSEESASASLHPGTDGYQARSESPARTKNALHAEQTRSSILRIQQHLPKFDEQSPGGRRVSQSPTRKTATEQSSQKAEKKLEKDSLDITSSKWLRTHGLVARRLTIMDALSPTAIPRTTKYVPILDKYVVSRVFDDVLPFAHVSNDKKLVTLINPQAVDLEAYKKRLQEAIRLYERRLDQIIWRALPQEEKDKFEQEKPVSFLEHKESLLSVLETLDWPITYEDIMMLEDEILTGLTYLRQATELQHASKEETQRVCPLHLLPARAALQIEPPPKRKHRGKMLDTLKGRRAIARSEGTGFYHPGVVIRCITPCYALVDFDNGQSEIVPVKFILPMGGAVPCPILQVGDYVLTRIRKQSGEEYWVPGIVMATPNKCSTADRLFTVLKFNNKKEHSVRNGLFKISHRRYTCTCCFINMIRMTDCYTPNVKIVKHFHRGYPSDEERERHTISAGGTWKKVKRRGKVQKEYYKECSDDSDSDDFVYVPRKVGKRRERGSPPSPRGKGRRKASLYYSSSPRRSPKGTNRCLSANTSDYTYPKQLRFARYPSMRQKSAPQLYSTFSSSSTSSNSSLSSIEKVEDLARRLQQYHIAQRRSHSADAEREQCML